MDVSGIICFFFTHLFKKKSPGKTFYEVEAMVAAIDDQFMWSKLTNSLVSPLFTSHDIQDTIFPSITSHPLINCSKSVLHT